MCKLFVSFFLYYNVVVASTGFKELKIEKRYSASTVCPDCKGSGVCPVCKGHPYAQDVQVDCPHCENWNNEYRSKVPCHVCKDTRHVTVKGCYGCTVKWILNLNPIPGKCSRCHGTGKIKDDASQKKTESENKKPKSDGLSEIFPDEGLYFGMKKNAYVQVIQKRFGLTNSSQNGDYNELTKSNVKHWIAANGNDDAPTDGSKITYKLYLDILGLDENGDPISEKHDFWNQPQKKDSTPTEQKSNTIQTETKSSIIGDRQDVFYLGVRDGYSEGGYIKTLQRVLRLKESGTIDQLTLDAVKKYISNEKYQQFFTEPVDKDALNVLSDKEKPGITLKLYNTIVRSNDLKILHNRNAKTPEDIID